MNFSFAFLQHEWTLVLHTVELETAVGMDSMTRWDCAIIGEFHTRRLSLNYSMIKYVWIFPSIVILEICQAQFIRWTLDKLWRITRRISFLFFCGFFFAFVFLCYDNKEMIHTRNRMLRRLPYIFYNRVFRYVFFPFRLRFFFSSKIVPWWIDYGTRLTFGLHNL